jgi:hypothetical protein
VDTTVSEERTASIFMVDVKIEAVCSSESCKTARHHNAGDHYLKVASCSVDEGALHHAFTGLALSG